MAESFEHYLETVRARRAELRDSVAAVEDALSRPIGMAHWRERVVTALAELAHDFADHVVLSEDEGGLFDNVLRADPRLVGAVGRQRDEHGVLRARLDEALRSVDHDQPLVGLTDYREEVTRLLGALVRHRQAASDLFYEAYAVDLGGQG